MGVYIKTRGIELGKDAIGRQKKEKYRVQVGQSDLIVMQRTRRDILWNELRDSR